MVKVICKGQHWEVKDNQLRLDTPDGQDLIRKMIRTLEQQIRIQIYNEICELDFTEDRKKIMKYGIENALLQVQDVCATVAKGDANA